VFFLNNQFFTPLKTIKTTSPKKKHNQQIENLRTLKKNKKKTPPDSDSTHQTTKKPSHFLEWTNSPAVFSVLHTLLKLRILGASRDTHGGQHSTTDGRIARQDLWPRWRLVFRCFKGGCQGGQKRVTFLGRKKKTPTFMFVLACCCFFVGPFFVSKNTQPDAGWLQGGVPWRDSKVDMLKKSHRLFTLSGCGET